MRKTAFSYCPKPAWAMTEWRRRSLRHFQDPERKITVEPGGYRRSVAHQARPKRPAELCYQDNVIVDLGGFIVARGVTHASQGEWKAIPQLLEQFPIHPVSLTMDTGYSAGELRQLLEDRGIKAYIPLRPIQEDRHGRSRRLRLSRRPAGLSAGKGASPARVQRKGTALHVHGAAGRLPRPARSGVIACRPDRSADMFRSPGITR